MNHRILLFKDDLSGGVVRELGGPGALRCPMGICAHPTAVMTAYVVDMGNTRLLRMSMLDGSVLASIGSHGTGPGELRSPQGCAVSGRRVYVADTSNNRVCVFEDSAMMGLDFLFAFGSEGSLPGELFGPTGVVVHGERVLVCERYNHRVSEFDAESGDFLRSFGGRGSSTTLGGFNEPFGIALLPLAAGGTRLLVSEYFGRRVQLLTENGIALQEIRMEERVSEQADSFGFGAVCTIAGPAPRMYVIEPKAGALHRMSIGGVPTLQTLCFESLASACQTHDEYRALVVGLRHQYVDVVMDLAHEIMQDGARDAGCSGRAASHGGPASMSTSPEYSPNIVSYDDCLEIRI